MFLYDSDVYVVPASCFANTSFPSYKYPLESVLIDHVL